MLLTVIFVMLMGIAVADDYASARLKRTLKKEEIEAKLFEKIAENWLKHGTPIQAPGHVSGFVLRPHRRTLVRRMRPKSTILIQRAATHDRLHQPEIAELIERAKHHHPHTGHNQHAVVPLSAFKPPNTPFVPLHTQVPGGEIKPHPDYRGDYFIEMAADRFFKLQAELEKLGKKTEEKNEVKQSMERQWLRNDAERLLSLQMAFPGHAIQLHIGSPQNASDHRPISPFLQKLRWAPKNNRDALRKQPIFSDFKGPVRFYLPIQKSETEVHTLEEEAESRHITEKTATKESPTIIHFEIPAKQTTTEVSTTISETTPKEYSAEEFARTKEAINEQVRLGVGTSKEVEVATSRSTAENKEEKSSESPLGRDTDQEANSTIRISSSVSTPDQETSSPKSEEEKTQEDSSAKSVTVENTSDSAVVRDLFSFQQSTTSTEIPSKRLSYEETSDSPEIARTSGIYQKHSLEGTDEDEGMKVDNFMISENHTAINNEYAMNGSLLKNNATKYKEHEAAAIDSYVTMLKQLVSSQMPATSSTEATDYDEEESNSEDLERGLFGDDSDEVSATTESYQKEEGSTELGRSALTSEDEIFQENYSTDSNNESVSTSNHFDDESSGSGSLDLRSSDISAIPEIESITGIIEANQPDYTETPDTNSTMMDDERGGRRIPWMTDADPDEHQSLDHDPIWEYQEPSPIIFPPTTMEVILDEDSEAAKVDALMPVVPVIVQALINGSVTDEEKEILEKTFKSRWADILAMAKQQTDLDMAMQGELGHSESVGNNGEGLQAIGGGEGVTVQGLTDEGNATSFLNYSRGLETSENPVTSSSGTEMVNNSTGISDSTPSETSQGSSGAPAGEYEPSSETSLENKHVVRRRDTQRVKRTNNHRDHRNAHYDEVLGEYLQEDYDENEYYGDTQDDERADFGEMKEIAQAHIDWKFRPA